MQLNRNDISRFRQVHNTHTRHSVIKAHPLPKSTRPPLFVFLPFAAKVKFEVWFIQWRSQSTFTPRSQRLSKRQTRLYHFLSRQLHSNSVFKCLLKLNYTHLWTGIYWTLHPVPLLLRINDKYPIGLPRRVSKWRWVSSCCGKRRNKLLPGTAIAFKKWKSIERLCLMVFITTTVHPPVSGMCTNCWVVPSEPVYLMPSSG